MTSIEEKVDLWFKRHLPSEEDKLRYIKFKDSTLNFVETIEEIIPDDGIFSSERIMVMDKIFNLINSVNMVISGDFYPENRVYSKGLRRNERKRGKDKARTERQKQVDEIREKIREREKLEREKEKESSS